MARLLVDGLMELPLPGSGGTLDRWRALATVGAFDLSLAKVYEGHTDAVAILSELSEFAPKGVGAVWASEPPQARVIFHPECDGGTLLGEKAWCSGASVVDFAVISVWTKAGEPMLACVEMRQLGISIDVSRWQAVGMAASESAAVTFDQVPAMAVGSPGDYVARPGFWQGGAGVAAVWFGAAVAIAQALAGSPRLDSDPHAAAHLGALDVALRGARALLYETAAWIDAHPKDNAASAALRVRASVEAAAQEVLLRVGRALGPGLLCGDAIHAQRCADLPVFIRQSHAEHDLAALGKAAVTESSAWSL